MVRLKNQRFFIDEFIRLSNIGVKMLSASSKVRRLREMHGYLYEMLCVRSHAEFFIILFHRQYGQTIQAFNLCSSSEQFTDADIEKLHLLHELKSERDSFKSIGIDYEEKAFYDILLAVSKKYAK